MQGSETKSKTFYFPKNLMNNQELSEQVHWKTRSKYKTNEHIYIPETNHQQIKGKDQNKKITQVSNVW